MFHVNQGRITGLKTDFHALEHVAHDHLGFPGHAHAIVEGQVFNVSAHQLGNQLTCLVVMFENGPPQLQFGGFSQGTLLTPKIDPPINIQSHLIGRLRFDLPVLLHRANAVVGGFALELHGK